MTPGGFKHLDQPSVSGGSARLTVKTQTLPNAIGDEGFQNWPAGNQILIHAQHNSKRCGVPRRLKPTHHLHTVIFSIWCQNQLIQFLKNQLQHFSSRQQAKQVIRSGLELIEHLTQRHRAFFQVVSGAFWKVLTQSQFGEFHNLINSLVTRSGFDGAEHGLNRCEHIPNLFGILHAFVVKMNPKMFPSTLVHLVNHFAFEVAHVEKTRHPEQRLHLGPTTLKHFLDRRQHASQSTIQQRACAGGPDGHFI